MKRVKFLTSIMLCILCLSFLVVGVWAVSVTVNFNLNGNLKYYPEGVYVELSGQVYRGSNVENMAPLTYDEKFTLNSITNYDNSTGEPSGNFPMESWEIGAIPFIPTEKFVKIKMVITNHSEIAIIGTPSILVDENLDISSITNLNVTENKLDVSYMQSGDTAIYELILEVTDSTEINNVLSVSFEFSIPEANYAYFAIENNQITGLTQKYIVDAPEILVIPGYTQDGLNQLSLAHEKQSGSGYVPTLNNINSTIVIIQEGLNEIGIGAFPSNNMIEIIIIPSTLTKINYYNNLANIKKMYFIDPNGWCSNGGGAFNYEYSIDELSDPYTAAIACVKNISTYGMNKS